MVHPEVTGDLWLEPTVGEHLRLAQLVKILDHATEDDLRKTCKMLAEIALLKQPCVIRYLTREAAKCSVDFVLSEEVQSQIWHAMSFQDSDGEEGSAL